MKELTDVTIVSNNINKELLNIYNEYQSMEKNFTYDDLIRYRKVIFYNVLSTVSSKKVTEVFEFLKSNNIMFINITNNPEQILLTKNLIVYDNNEIVLNGEKEEVLNEEKVFRKLGIKMPFIIELSHYLKDYNLVNKNYYDKESLVGDLWK